MIGRQAYSPSRSNGVSRFKRRFPCPICGGGDDDPRGKETRCYGFLSTDGKFAHCTRVEHGEQEDCGTWAHPLESASVGGNGHAYQPPPPRISTDFRRPWELLASDDAAGTAYLESRNLRQLPPGLVKFDAEDSIYRVALALQDRAGKIVGIERRAIAPADPKLMCIKGSTKTGSTLGYVNGNARVLVVEGAMDFVAASVMAGALDVCAIGIPGASTTRSAIDARVDQLKDKTTFLLFDNDDKGEEARADAGKILLGAGAQVFNARYPAGYKDLTEIVEQMGAEKATAVMSEVLAEATAQPNGPAIEAQEELEDNEPEPPPTPAEFLRRESRNLVRLRTGLPTLDEATRGGIPTGIVTTILGGPHTGKTALASQIAIRAAEVGYFVVILFKDEGRFAGTVRLGQQLGLNRERLEFQDPAEMGRLEAALAERDIRLPDGDSPHWALEKLIPWAEKARGDRPLFIAVDSIQSAYSDDREDRPLREEITAKMRLLEGAAKRGAFIVSISEMNRAGYRNKNDADNTRGIASGAESRAIEFVSRLIVSLAGDSDRVITATLEKNSPGKKAAMTLKFDFATALFREIDQDEAERIADEARETADNAKRARGRERIRRALRASPELNARELERAAGGKKESHKDCRDEMVEEGALLAREVGAARLYRLPENE